MKMLAKIGPSGEPISTPSFLNIIKVKVTIIGIILDRSFHPSVVSHSEINFTFGDVSLVVLTLFFNAHCFF